MTRIATDTQVSKLPPPQAAHNPIARLIRLAKRLFGTPLNAAISTTILLFGFWLFPPLIEWALLDAVWSEENAHLCKEAGAGACWSVIDARYRLILFGVYPAEEHWRAALACLAIIVTVIFSCIPAFWTPKRLSLTWILGFASYLLLMRGGFAGLTYVGTTRWGGLSLTLFIFSSVCLLGMPMSVMLALARQSKLPVIRMLAAGAIDLTKSFPLLTILFTAAVILPYALPDWLQGDKLYRVIVAFAFFFACYQAEIFRGGYQVIDKGQREAATALGMGFWKREFLVMLPQVFAKTLPPTINQFVITFKETSIVVIIGFFDILASSNAAIGTGKWVGYFVEAYIFAALIYFVFVFSLSRYGAYLETRTEIVER